MTSAVLEGILDAQDWIYAASKPSFEESESESLESEAMGLLITVEDKEVLREGGGGTGREDWVEETVRELEDCARGVVCSITIRGGGVDVRRVSDLSSSISPSISSKSDSVGVPEGE